MLYLESVPVSYTSFYINHAKRPELNKMLTAAILVPKVNPKLPLFTEIADALRKNKIIHSDLNSLILKYFEVSIKVTRLPKLNTDSDHKRKPIDEKIYYTPREFGQLWIRNDIISIDICGILELTDPGGVFHFEKLQNIKGHVIVKGSAASMFKDLKNFTGDISKWDISQVTDMSNMFANAAAFNDDLSGWDTSHVTDMSGIFDRAISFSQNLSAWDVSRVTNMGGMFYNAKNFKSDLSRWDVSQVTNMRRMFMSTFYFNSDLSRWDTSNVIDISDMFYDSTFKQDLSDWNLDRVENVKDMLRGAKNFKGELKQNSDK